jgi:DNA (cytosine-5)-methyltransferase 1
MALGFQQAGFGIAGFIELDTAAAATFSANFTSSQLLARDITTVTEQQLASWKHALGEVDVLCGGPPCQGFSLAGKRDPNDHRNRLFLDYLRVAAALRPRVIIIENVRLLTSMKSATGSAVVDDITQAFRSEGYHLSHQVLNAQDYGVPQFRERVFFVGLRELPRPGTPLFPFPTHGPGNSGEELFNSRPLPYRTFRDAAGDLERLESGEQSATDPYHWAVRHPDHVLEWLRDVPEGKSAHDNADPRLRPPSGYNTTYKRLRWDEPSSTIGTTFGMISACRNVHPRETRSLTIREALRCQSFPDTFKLFGTTGDIRTQIGNAVPPTLARAIAAHIRTFVLERSPLTANLVEVVRL